MTDKLRGKPPKRNPKEPFNLPLRMVHVDQKRLDGQGNRVKKVVTIG